MADSLKSRTLYALFWSFVESFGLQGVRFIIGVVLARILFPEQFGLIAILTLFIAVAQSFLDSGFGSALIQKQEVTSADTNSIFYFNIVVGVVAAGILCLVAPWIAAFYRQPILTSLTRMSSLVLVINSFALIQTTILTKKIDFKTQTKVSLVAGIGSGILAVVLAMSGFGVWSLALQQIFASLIRTVFLWLFNPWRPSLTFSFAALRQMFGFGSRVFFSGLIDQVFENIYSLVIGRLFSASDLGYFARASSIEQLPAHTLGGMVGRVVFPVFSTIQNDSVRLKRGLRKAFISLAMISFPVMIGLAAVADPLVRVLLTDKWSPSVPYLQLLCLAGILYSGHLTNLSLLKAMGRSDLFLRLEIIKKLLVVANIAITWRWGIRAMAAGIVIVSVLSYFVNCYYTNFLVGYSLREQLCDMAPYLVVSVLMGIGAYAVGLMPFPNYWVMLAVQVVFGIGTYLSLCRLFRLEVFMENWVLVGGKLRSLPSRQGARAVKLAIRRKVRE